MSKQKNPQKNNFSYLLLLAFSFLAFVFFNSQRLFAKFDLQVVNNYLRSQDIEDKDNNIKDRIILSDFDIYIASGYLYAIGESPIKYNFQHPPLIKYLFGFSAKYFNLPLLPNLIFGFILLLEVYLLGKFVFKSDFIGFIASLALLIDPVFKEVTIYALLDLGQVVFLLGYVITSLKCEGRTLTCLIMQGILLGFALASKFYSPIFIFLTMIYLYKIINKQFNLKKEILVLIVALISFASTYLTSFINGDFNFFFHQAKIIKFMLDHNQAVEWGGVIPMFFGGYFLWPISFFVTLFLLLKEKFMSLKFLFFLIPISYLLILNFQLSFTRYFILILPFLCLSLTQLIYRLYNTHCKFKG